MTYLKKVRVTRELLLIIFLNDDKCIKVYESLKPICFVLVTLIMLSAVKESSKEGTVLVPTIVVTLVVKI